MNRMCADARWLVATVITVTAAVASLLAEGDSQSARFLAESHAAMTKMMTAIDAKPTGDVDADFAAMMIAHHVGAIEMAQAELRAGRNEQLRRLAQEIIVTQQQEIEVMRLALAQKSHSGPAAHDAAREFGHGRDANEATSASQANPVSHRDRVYAAEQFSNNGVRDRSRRQQPARRDPPR